MKPLHTYTSAVAEQLDDEFLAGHAPVTLAEKPVPVDAQDLVGPTDVELVKGLVDHALSLDLPKFALDGWLAPRLHAALRLHPRVASDPGVWRWLAIEVMSPYVRARHTGPTGVVLARHYAHHERLKNAAGRLWWAAELLRNGPNYEIVPHALENVVAGEFSLELRYSWYRPAAIAFARVAMGMDGGKKLNDKGLRSLSRKINSYLTLRSLEAAGAESNEQHGYDLKWREHQPSLEDLADDTLPKGPEDGYASGDSVTELEKWFRSIATAG